MRRPQRCVGSSPTFSAKLDSKSGRSLTPPAKRVVPKGMGFEYSALRQWKINWQGVSHAWKASGTGNGMGIVLSVFRKKKEKRYALLFFMSLFLFSSIQCIIESFNLTSCKKYSISKFRHCIFFTSWTFISKCSPTGNIK